MSEDIDELRQELADTKALAKQAMQYAGSLADRVDELEVELHQLREENERLRDQEQMFQDVRKAMQADPEERAVVLIKALNNEALTNQQIGRDPAAEVDKDGAKKALGGSLRRQQIYTAMDEAERLVGDKDVLWKQTGTRGTGGKATKLRLDLDEGDLPRTIAGEKIRQEPYGGAD